MHTNAVLAVIAGVLAVPTVWTLVNDGTEFTDVDQIPKLFEGFTPDNVHIIRVVRAKKAGGESADPKAEPGVEQLVFQRDDDKWVLASGELAGAPVKEFMITDEILGNIGKIPASKDAVIVVDAKDEDLKKRGLTQEDGLRITCVRADGQAIVADLFVGNESNDGAYGQDKVRGRYVRKVAADNDTGRKSILLFENDNFRVTTEQNDYIDTKVLEIADAAEIQKFGYSNPTGTKVLFERTSETDTKWKVVEGPEGVGAVRQGEVDNLVNRFLFLNAQRYEAALARIPPAELAAKYKVQGRPEFVVTATLKDGSTKKMTVGAKIDDKNEYWATFEGSPFLCAIGDWIVSPFEKAGKDLFDPSAKDVKPGDEKSGDGDKEPGDEPKSGDGKPAGGDGKPGGGGE